MIERARKRLDYAGRIGNVDFFPHPATFNAEEAKNLYKARAELQNILKPHFALGENKLKAGRYFRGLSYVSGAITLSSGITAITTLFDKRAGSIETATARAEESENLSRNLSTAAAK